MDRETCRANFKKLRLSGVKSTGNHKGKISSNDALSNYFRTQHVNETKVLMKKEEEFKVNNSRSPSTMTNNVDLLYEQDKKNSEIVNHFGSLQRGIHLAKNRKRTKLKDFILSKGGNVTSNDKRDSLIINNSDDRKRCIETPLQKKPKMPTKLQKARFSTDKTSRCINHQPDIKSSLIRSERIFSEIADQHCSFDNFSADEIELAISLSKSVVETCGREPYDGDKQYTVNQHSEDDNSNIKTVLEKYGFRTFLEGVNATRAVCMPLGGACLAQRFGWITIDLAGGFCACLFKRNCWFTRVENCIYILYGVIFFAFYISFLLAAFMPVWFTR